MEPRGCFFVCLLCVVSCGIVVFGNEGHGSICRSNERFLSCGGCQKTCKDPTPECKAVCRTGCYCEEEEVRNETGHCVKLADCPSMDITALHFSEPRNSDSQCPVDEEYRSCEPCNKTCDNPNPICPAQCARGCFCRDDLVRDRDGRCVKLENCSIWKKNESSNLIKPIAYQLTCSAHQVYSSCRSCERTCSSPVPICSYPCSAGCYCEDGYLKAPSGNCVRFEDCPKAEVSFGGVHEPSIEDCSQDEIYLSCGWCEPTCTEPRPECPRGICTRGCLCRPPLLRHHSGHCVTEDNCKPQKCIDPNEEFVCRYGCEARCDAMKCTSRPRLCVLGCHCRLSLLRDVNGMCVTPENCQVYSVNLNVDIRVNNSDTSIINYNNITSVFNTSSSSEDGQELDSKSLPVKSKGIESVFDVMPNINPQQSKDIISQAVKLYTELLNSPLKSKEFYVLKSLKDFSNGDDSLARNSQI